jgi:tetratricopeptide (TPR) repeat protein
MTTLTTTFDIPAKILEGLTTGSYERVGGVVRDVVTKQIVMWLRETGGSSITPAIPLPLDPVTGALSVAISAINTGVSAYGFHQVNGKLEGMSQQLGTIAQTVQRMEGVLQITSAASILNLGVSAAGFAVILHRLNELEGRLQKSQEVLNKINHKIDLGYYANFRAALDLANSAFTMSKPENRKNCALQAINRFLEAEHIYADYVDQELEKKSQIADEYLLTLSLAYLAEARCYLELEEFDTALQRFREGSVKLRSRICRYIELLLTSNPAAYLHPQLKEQIDLRRLTKIYQWLDPRLDEAAVFELQRKNLYNLEKEQGIASGYKWVTSLPDAIVMSTEVKGTIFGNKEETKEEAMKRLPQVFEVMESMVETNQRFEAYQLEVQAIAQLGMSFYGWTQLTVSDSQSEGANLMYILPSEPLSL